jgi:uncharacterized RDD family membrane protein YckC
MSPGIRVCRFRLRLAVVAIDGCVVLALVFAFGYALLRPLLTAPSALPWLDHLADMVLQHGSLLLRLGALLAGLGTSYLVVFHGLLGRTPGEWVAGVRVLGPEGEPASPARLLARVGALLPSVGLLGAGFWWAAADRERRAWHDRASGTYLARIRGADEGAS